MALRLINNVQRAKNVHHMSPLFYSSMEVGKHSVKDSKGRIILTNFQNSNFEKFYQAQNVCAEEDFPDMMKAFRNGLPSVFRHGHN